MRESELNKKHLTKGIYDVYYNQKVKQYQRIDANGDGQTREGKMKIGKCEIGKNISPNGEYFKSLNYLKSIANEYRNDLNPRSNTRNLLVAELEKYGAVNINNGSGKFIIVI